jgi:hypothetical protein
MTLSDQERVVTGGSFQATEMFSPSGLDKAAAQSAASHPYC